MPTAASSHGTVKRTAERPLPHSDLAIQKSWQNLSADVPERASQRPLPHVNDKIQRSWDELAETERASQRPLPHVNGRIQQSWEELSKDALPHDTSEVQKGWGELCGDVSCAAPAMVIPNCDRFDSEAFRNFAPLLSACQPYARQSGFRFRSNSFDGLDNVATTLAQLDGTSKALKQDASSGSRLAAKITAAPVVRWFSDRLAARDAPLMEELETAYRIVVAESARNMMIATVKGLNLFPPVPAPQGVSSDDCSYEDVAAPLPMIAQRLYNDLARRQRDEGLQGRQQRRAMTAAFLVDFSHHAGAAVPDSPETYQTLLKEFSQRHFEYADREAATRRSAAELEAAKEALKSKARAVMEKDAELQALWTKPGAEALRKQQAVEAAPSMPVPKVPERRDSARTETKRETKQPQQMVWLLNWVRSVVS